MTPREEVLKVYPDAKPVNIGTKKGLRYYHIVTGENAFLGQGKSKSAAWKAASKNN